MTQWFSTDLVPVSDRLDAWLCNAKQVCGDCRFHFPKRVPFHGSIERRALGRWAFTRFASTPVSFAKFPVVSGKAEDTCCILITQLEGMRRYCQNGSVAVLTPGDTTLIDAGTLETGSASRVAVTCIGSSTMGLVCAQLTEAASIKGHATQRTTGLSIKARRFNIAEKIGC